MSTVTQRQSSSLLRIGVTSGELAAGAVFVLAALLRLWSLNRVTGNTFYDAAVRSMGHSWHNFFFGALEPSGSVAVDKAPVDLWLQVASTKAIGFSLFSLHLPEALGGALAALLLYLALRVPLGELAAAIAALAFALLPISVLTSRSDTMDSVLAALALAALWLSLRALRDGRARYVIAAAALMGLGFNIKLAESLVPLPALALLWWWAAGRGRARVRTLLGAALAYVVLALAWTVPAALTPLSARPFPIGSDNGSIWRVVFVFNGLDRVTGHGPVGLAGNVAGGGPGPLRLLSTGASHYGLWVGVELLAALALGALALVAARWRPRLPTDVRGRTLVALVLWLLTGLVLFSAMKRLQPRYLEIFAPAVAGVLGASVAALLRATSPRAWTALVVGGLSISIYVIAAEHGVNAAAAVTLGGAVLLALVAWRARRLRAAAAVAVAMLLVSAPLAASLDIVRYHVSDAALPDPTAGKGISRYLLSHRDGARYELASASVFDVTGLIARDDRPVLVLNDIHGEIVTAAQLAAKVASRQVRYLLLLHPCTSGPGCPGNLRWAEAHSLPVRGHRGLYRFGAG